MDKKLYCGHVLTTDCARKVTKDDCRDCRDAKHSVNVKGSAKKRSTTKKIQQVTEKVQNLRKEPNAPTSQADHKPSPAKVEGLCRCKLGCGHRCNSSVDDCSTDRFHGEICPPSCPNCSKNNILEKYNAKLR